MASRSGSSSAFASLMSLVMLIVLAAGLFLVWQGGREPPLRTVQLEAPLPELPTPPGLLPDATLAP